MLGRAILGKMPQDAELKEVNMFTEKSRGMHSMKLVLALLALVLLIGSRQIPTQIAFSRVPDSQQIGSQLTLDFPHNPS
jgi:hypothetical protein